MPPIKVNKKEHKKWMESKVFFISHSTEHGIEFKNHKQLILCEETRLRKIDIYSLN